MSNQEQKPICPKDGLECSWVSEENGSIWCYHYEGYEKTPEGKIRKKVKKHYLGRAQYVRGHPGEQTLSQIEFELKEIEEKLQKAKSEKERKKLEMQKQKLEELKQQILERSDKSNIHLRPISDENRFIEYIKESLELMQLQPGFDDKKIIEVLKAIEEFLKKNLQYASTFIPELKRIEEDLMAEVQKSKKTTST